MAIYDCFTFYNEYELLEFRLGLLYDVVDYFVISELDVTQSGEPKGYNFLENKDRFLPYMDKIIYLKETNAPVLSGKKKLANKSDKTMTGDWAIENYQRNCIIHGLKDCDFDDLIIISDLDEIPNPDILRDLDKQAVFFNFEDFDNWKAFAKGIAYLMLFSKSSTRLIDIFRNRCKVKDVLKYMPISLEIDIYYYFLNCKSNGKIHSPILSYYKNLMMPQTMRNVARCSPYIKNAGWHLSYMGGMERIKQKLSAIIEGNPNIGKDEEYIKACLKQGKDLYGRKGKEFEYKFVKLEDIDIPSVGQFIKKYPEFYYSEEKN